MGSSLRGVAPGVDVGAAVVGGGAAGAGGVYGGGFADGGGAASDGWRQGLGVQGERSGLFAVQDGSDGRVEGAEVAEIVLGEAGVGVAGELVCVGWRNGV
ncbi:hypothetical protein [Haloechinothrix salitolerans]|uniref:hypothetical protein n=1 Tax=Haloechinothrix salitolerans TaxID=926830 RepID=UPI0031E71E39